MKLLIDLDGTLAEWNPDGESKLLEKGYFRTLKPLQTVLTIKLLSGFYDTYILSAVMENSLYAKQEKREWIREFLPEIQDDHILFSADGCSKKDFIHKTFGEIKKTDVLMDDYSKNLKDWAENGSCIKILNGTNGKGGSEYDLKVNALDDPIKNAILINSFLLNLQREERSKLC